jgi:hypothetical protein
MKAIKITFLTACISALYTTGFSQNAKIMDSPSGTVISNAGGTDTPASPSILDVRSFNKGIFLPRIASTASIASPTAGLLFYNTTSNQFNYHDGAAWQQATFGNQWNVNGTSYYYNGGNVGIGNSTPNYKLDVGGTIHNAGDIHTDGWLGIGTTNPQYRVHIFDGSVAFYNSTDLKTWSIYYNSTNNGIQFNENGSGGTSRLNIANGGNVGIGVVSPTSKLDVAGTIHTSNNINVDGNGAISGALTVNNNHGVAYNPSSATNLRIVPFTTATFAAILPGFGLSTEGSIVFGGNFTSVPKVFVGDIDVTGGASGELYRVQLILYGCAMVDANSSSCKARLLNTSPNAVNYTITWNCVAIGN